MSSTGAEALLKQYLRNQSNASYPRDPDVMSESGQSAHGRGGRRI